MFSVCCCCSCTSDSLRRYTLQHHRKQSFKCNRAKQSTLFKCFRATQFISVTISLQRIHPGNDNDVTDDDLWMNTSCSNTSHRWRAQLADAAGHFSCRPCFAIRELCTLTKSLHPPHQLFWCRCQGRFVQLSSIPGMWSAPGYSGAASVGNLKTQMSLSRALDYVYLHGDEIESGEGTGV